MGVQPPKTHELLQLLMMLAPHAPQLLPLQPDAVRLTPYGVAIRYPHLAATDTEAREAMASVRRIRRAVSRELGL